MELKEEATDVFSFDLLTADDAAAFLQACRDAPWAPAPAPGPASPGAYERMSHCFEPQLSALPGLAPLVGAALERAQRAASARWRWPLKKVSDTRLIRYETGGFAAEHADYHPGSTCPWRQISLICYLNDDYAGGRTVFSRQRLEVAPRAGKAILFPSGISHPHAVKPVTAGTRYVFVSWLA